LGRIQALDISGNPIKMTMNAGQTEHLYAQRPIWLTLVNDVRTIIQQQKEYIYIPDLRTYASF